MRLELIELDKGAEEGARRQAEAAQEVRAEDYPLAFLRRRRDLPLRHETDPHLVLAGKPPRLAEEVDVVHMDVGAVPVPAVLHDGEELARKDAAAKGCCDGEKEEEDGGARVSVRASAAPPPPPTYRHGTMKPRGRTWGMWD